MVGSLFTPDGEVLKRMQRNLTLVLLFVFIAKGNGDLNIIDWEHTQQRKMQVSKDIIKELLINLNEGTRCPSAEENIKYQGEKCRTCIR